MATYVLIHGAGGDGASWQLVTAELERLGHEVIAPDLGCDDDTRGLREYTDTVIAAIGDRAAPIVVAHSLGGFTAPLVCARVPASLMVLVAAMIPRPGERPGDWWANTGWEQARAEAAERGGWSIGWDPFVNFLHDVPAEALAVSTPREQSGTPFELPWPLDAWPDVPTRLLSCRDDRFFPAEFLRRVALDRLGLVPDEMDGGHVPALHSPVELVRRLEAYRGELS